MNTTNISNITFLNAKGKVLSLNSKGISLEKNLIAAVTVDYVDELVEFSSPGEYELSHDIGLCDVSSGHCFHVILRESTIPCELKKIFSEHDIPVCSGGAKLSETLRAIVSYCDAHAMIRKLSFSAPYTGIFFYAGKAHYLSTDQVLSSCKKSSAEQPFKCQWNIDTDRPESDVLIEVLQLLEKDVKTYAPIFSSCLFAILKAFTCNLGLKPFPVIWISGITGSGKTELAKGLGTFLNHSCSGVSSGLFPLHEKFDLAEFPAHNTPIILDDNRNAHVTATNQKIGGNLEAIIRDVFSDQYAKQLSLLITGEIAEAIQTSESLRNRCVTIRLSSDSDVNSLRKEQIANFYRNPLLIPTCVYNFFQFLAEHADRNTLLKLYESSESDCASIEMVSNTERLHDNITMIFFSFKVLMHYAHQNQLICSSRGDQFLCALKQGLTSLYEENLEYFDMGYEDLFLKLLLSAIENEVCTIQKFKEEPYEDDWNADNTDLQLQNRTCGLYIASTHGLDNLWDERSIIIFDTERIFACVNKQLEEYCRKEHRSISRFTSKTILHLLGERNIAAKSARTNPGEYRFNYQFTIWRADCLPRGPKGFILNKTVETQNIFSAVSEKGIVPSLNYNERLRLDDKTFGTFINHLRTKR